MLQLVKLNREMAYLTRDITEGRFVEVAAGRMACDDALSHYPHLAVCKRRRPVLQMVNLTSCSLPPQHRWHLRYRGSRLALKVVLWYLMHLGVPVGVPLALKVVIAPLVEPASNEHRSDRRSTYHNHDGPSRFAGAVLDDTEGRCNLRRCNLRHEGKEQCWWR